MHIRCFQSSEITFTLYKYLADSLDAREIFFSKTSYAFTGYVRLQTKLLKLMSNQFRNQFQDSPTVRIMRIELCRQLRRRIYGQPIGTYYAGHTMNLVQDNAIRVQLSTLPRFLKGFAEFQFHSKLKATEYIILEYVSQRH